MSQVDVIGLAEIAAIEYADIVIETFVPEPNELRIHLKDGSFIALTDPWIEAQVKAARRR